MKLKLQKKPLKSLSKDTVLHLHATPQVAGGVKITEWCSLDKKFLVTDTCYVTDQKDCSVM